MADTFRALWTDAERSTTLRTDMTEAELGERDVVVDVEYSSLNYKDALALTGDASVLPGVPLVPGIDVIGTVRASRDRRFGQGQRVVATGWGLGERHSGGLAERAVLDGDWVLQVPDALTPRHTAALGTAGLTAALSVLALERQLGDLAGREVLVTGAAGGVGSVALALLGRAGARVTALTGRTAEAEYLRALGATEVLDRAELGEPGRPLQRQRWHAVLDAVGGPTLVNALAQLRYGGVATACGMTHSVQLPGTVIPFILRGVSLVGVDSVQAPREARDAAWRRLADTVEPALLESVTTEIALGDALEVAPRLLAGAVRGRTVVDVSR